MTKLILTALISNLILLLVSSTTLAQTVTAKYLDPNHDDPGRYRLLRFGSSSQYWGGLMWNESSPAYGDGDDFALFTYNNRDLVLRSGNGNIILHPNKNSKVGIGTKNPTQTLTINGTAQAEEIIVEESIGADFVFADDYTLPSLSEVEQHIRERKHLPEIPSAEEMKRDGVKVGELQIKLLQKIEELTLHTIEQQKMFLKQQSENQVLKRRFELIEKRMSADNSISKGTQQPILHKMVPLHTFFGGILPNGLIIDENGNVGIGTSNPSYKLDVIGNARFSGDIYFSNGFAIEKVSKRIENDPLSFDASTLGSGTFKIIVQGANMGSGNDDTMYAEYIYQDLHWSEPQLYQAKYLRNWGAAGYGHVSHSGSIITVTWGGKRSAQISVIEMQKDW